MASHHMTSSVSLGPKIIPAAKAHPVACTTCTFLNMPGAQVCEMCGAEIKPPTHDVQANGMWRCGSCSNLNRKGLKQCSECAIPFSTSVTSSAPSQIFCSRCGFLNDGDNMECVQCDNQLRSRLEKIGTDLRDSTNFLARDIGVNINVKCPGCMIVCYVPPATAGLRCGTCHTYFASPTVGEVTNFHMNRLARSFRGFFTSASTPSDGEIPVGRLIAIGELARQRSTSNPQAESLAESSRSIESSHDAEGKESVGVEVEEAAEQKEEQKSEQKDERHEVHEEPGIFQEMRPATPPSTRAVTPTKAVRTHLPLAVPASPAVEAAEAPVVAPMAVYPQDLVEVEGDIVEL
ncbi:hypothetical protein Poli38472_005884 [Pythium oligandrum]|uniref:RanBP2-type domain-containing protein n=1 Tax=Pythium oligandrum TaxID=41045 RepID=A0A8K1FMN0_PYTOL|nr:hypothetical protein Poli38472_005884 [Pythium oligandrum]|eukprot:TMW68416.1 hypothetical protein Poli38472_005884 [Pythium oligandrum]